MTGPWFCQYVDSWLEGAGLPAIGAYLCLVNFILKLKVKSWFSAFHRDSPEFGSFLSSDYVVCLVSGGKSGLDLYPLKWLVYFNLYIHFDR